MNTSNAFYILALNNATPAEDLKALKGAGLDYKPVLGFWHGVSEVSYIIPAGLGVEGIVCILAVEHGQEMFLKVENTQCYAFSEIDGFEDAHHLGTWKVVSKEQAKKKGEYTFDHLTALYYSTV